MKDDHIMKSGKNQQGLESDHRHQIILAELQDRLLWFIRLRWWVPVGMMIAIALALLLEIQFAALALWLTALLILGYNIIFYFWSRRFRHQELPTQAYYHFSNWQVGLDFGAMFLMIHFTGGAASPLRFFLIFHIIFASMLLPKALTYAYSILAVVGLALIALLEYTGVFHAHEFAYSGQIVRMNQQPFQILIDLSFFAATVFITAYSTGVIMSVLKQRIINLALLSKSLIDLNDRIQTLFFVIEAIVNVKTLREILIKVTEKLAHVMEIKGISVKLLSADKKMLQFTAAYGLPEEFVDNKVVEVARSPLNKRIISGEPFVAGNVSEKEQFQFSELLAAANIQSVLFVPLICEKKVIGILGAYCTRADRFSPEDMEFFRIAGRLVGIALENARAAESIEKYVQERSWFMMKVAHNLRAPVAAMISILAVVRKGYLGDLTETQTEYLDRLDRRAKNMLLMVNEFMLLASSRGETERAVKEAITPEFIVTRTRRTFTEAALAKDVDFEVVSQEGAPTIHGDPRLVEQIIENLVSNAIKYTPTGGKVTLTLSPAENALRLEISDTGIGIPHSAMPKLFTEFFRADNAKKMENSGAGLGLAIVKELVDKLNGKIIVESEEGAGTLFVVHLPISAAQSGQIQPGT